MKKIAVILHAEPGTHDALGRALHALLYTRELQEGGHDVRLIFDGGGTEWIEEMSKPDSKLNPLYDAVKNAGSITGVCDFCIAAFDGDRNQVRQEGLVLISEYQGHPSLGKLIDEGYQVITL